MQPIHHPTCTSGSSNNLSTASERLRAGLVFTSGIFKRLRDAFMLEARPLTSTSSLLNKPRTGARLLIREIPTVHSIVTVSLPDDPISASGHERRPMQLTPACQFPVCPVSDRGCVAVQYVAKGQKRSFRLLTSGRTIVAWQGNDE